MADALSAKTDTGVVTEVHMGQPPWIVLQGLATRFQVCTQSGEFMTEAKHPAGALQQAWKPQLRQPWLMAARARQIPERRPFHIASEHKTLTSCRPSQHPPVFLTLTESASVVSS